MNIQKTTDYSQFKLIAGNRPLSRSNLIKITKSISKRNMLEIAPIIVNENNEIIDGQHRFQVAKINKLPIYFVSIKDAGLPEVHALNNVSRKWSTEDYIQSYAVQGNRYYKRLLKFMNEFDVPFSIAITFLGTKENGHAYTVLKSGNLEISDEQFIKGEYLVLMYQSILGFFIGSRMRGEYLARAIIATDKKGLLQKLVQTMIERDLKISHQPSVIEYLREFENILNWKKKTEGANIVRLF